MPKKAVKRHLKTFKYVVSRSIHNDRRERERGDLRARYRALAAFTCGMRKLISQNNRKIIKLIRK